MEIIDILRSTWFLLIGILFAGYSILDGFDFGVGMLVPFIAKDDKHKKILIDTIWPLWDGNEVWLIAGAGALFAAFPAAYAAVFSGFYMLFMLVLFALIFRAVSMEFWYYDEARRKVWAGLFAFGSFLPPLLFGILLGNIVLGVPLNDEFQFTGDIITIFRPLPVITGLVVLLLMIVHGALYIIIKTEGELRERARNAAGRLWILLFIVFAVSIASVFLFIPGSFSDVRIWIPVLLNIALLIILRSFIKNKKEISSFILSSLMFILLWIGAGAIIYPDLLKDINGPDSLTIYNASSSQLTLQIMLIFACIGMPIVIAYTVFVYRVFKGKAS